MTNSTRLPLTFGLRSGGEDFATVLTLAQAADEAGFYGMAFADRPHDPVLDGWTLSTAVAARTNKLRVSHMTLNIPFRYPAVLAKEAATLDLISGGRLDVILGAGDDMNRPLYDSIGVPLAAAGERLQDLRDCITILRGLWSNEKFSFQGRVYQLDEAQGRPHPVQRPIPITVGARLSRTLRLAGDLADGMVKNRGWTTSEEMQQLNQAVDLAAEKAGRDPKKIRRIMNGTGFLARDAAEKDAFLEGTGGGRLAGGSPSAGGLIGTTEEVLERVREYRAAGVDSFILRLPEDSALDQVKRFSEAVLPEAASL